VRSRARIPGRRAARAPAGELGPRLLQLGCQRVGPFALRPTASRSDSSSAPTAVRSVSSSVPARSRSDRAPVSPERASSSSRPPARRPVRVATGPRRGATRARRRPRCGASRARRPRPHARIARAELRASASQLDPGVLQLHGETVRALALRNHGGAERVDVRPHGVAERLDLGPRRLAIRLDPPARLVPLGHQGLVRGRQGLPLASRGRRLDGRGFEPGGDVVPVRGRRPERRLGVRERRQRTIRLGAKGLHDLRGPHQLGVRPRDHLPRGVGRPANGLDLLTERPVLCHGVP
jgi:hypothetical protein